MQSRVNTRPIRKVACRLFTCVSFSLETFRVNARCAGQHLHHGRGCGALRVQQGIRGAAGTARCTQPIAGGRALAPARLDLAALLRALRLHDSRPANELCPQPSQRRAAAIGRLLGMARSQSRSGLTPRLTPSPPPPSPDLALFRVAPLSPWILHRPGLHNMSRATVAAAVLLALVAAPLVAQAQTPLVLQAYITLGSRTKVYNATGADCTNLWCVRALCSLHAYDLHCGLTFVNVHPRAGTPWARPSRPSTRRGSLATAARSPPVSGAQLALQRAGVCHASAPLMHTLTLTRRRAGTGLPSQITMIMNFTTTGQGQPLVNAYSWLNSSAIWNNLLPAFAAGCQSEAMYSDTYQGGACPSLVVRILHQQNRPPPAFPSLPLNTSDAVNSL